VTESSSSYAQRPTESQWQKEEPNNTLLQLLPDHHGSHQLIKGPPPQTAKEHSGVKATGELVQATGVREQGRGPMHLCCQKLERLE